MSFRLGKASEENLLGVRPPIVTVVRRAIEITLEDFGVHEGVRAMARQRLLVDSGASRTLDSYHLTGDAVDLVPYVDGKLQWQTPLCLAVARAMHQASIEHSVPMTWGGVWDHKLHELDPHRLEDEIEDYIARYRATHPPRVVTGASNHSRTVRPHPLIDVVHFQGVRP